MEEIRSLTPLGRTEFGAVPVVRPPALNSPTLESGSLYVTWTDLHEQIARAFDDLRMTDSAATHYRYVAKALERSDDGAKPRYEAASRRLAAMDGQR